MSLFLALALAAATPPAPGSIIPVPVRYEMVFNVAEVACKAAWDHNSGDEASKYVSSVAERMVLSDDETILLLNYCIMFVDGAAAK